MLAKRAHIPFFVLTIFLVGSFLPQQVANADVLCVKKNARVVRGRIKLAKALKRVTDECPKGFTELVNTDEFAGPAGADGSDGQDGVLGYQVVTELLENETIQGMNAGRAVLVDCPSGASPTGGSCEVSNGSFHLSESFLTETGWRCEWRNIATSQSTADFEAQVICATTP